MIVKGERQVLPDPFGGDEKLTIMDPARCRRSTIKNIAGSGGAGRAAEEHSGWRKSGTPKK
jgi:hypothetical protein